MNKFFFTAYSVMFLNLSLYCMEEDQKRPYFDSHQYTPDIHHHIQLPWERQNQNLLEKFKKRYAKHKEAWEKHNPPDWELVDPREPEDVDNYEYRSELTVDRCIPNNNVEQFQEYLDGISFLLNNGADSNSTFLDKTTPGFLEERMEFIQRLDANNLSDASEDSNVMLANACSLILEWIVHQKISYNNIEQFQEYGIKLRLLDRIEFLLKMGADPNSTRLKNFTVLTRILQTDRFQSQFRENLVYLLLKYGANPYYKEENGKTPIDLAYRKGLNKLAAIMQLYVLKRQFLQTRLLFEPNDEISPPESFSICLDEISD